MKQGVCLTFLNTRSSFMILNESEMSRFGDKDNLKHFCTVI